MDELKSKIESLFSILGGSRDLDFLCAAFCDFDRGEVAQAVFALCAEGKLVVDAQGIRLAETDLPVEAKDDPCCDAEAEGDTDGDIVHDLDEPAPVQDQDQTPVTLEPAWRVPVVAYSESPLRHDEKALVLPLPTRAVNALERKGVQTVAQLVEELDELADMPGLGISSVMSCADALRDRASRFEQALDDQVRSALREVSGNSEFVFDAFGFLVLAGKGAKESCGLLEGPAHPMDLLTGLSEANIRRLRACGLTTVEGLVQCDPINLGRMPKVGPGLVENVRDELQRICPRLGISLNGWGKAADEQGTRSFLDMLDDLTSATLRQAADLCEQRLYPLYRESFYVLYAGEARSLALTEQNLPIAAEKLVGQMESLDELVGVCMACLKARFAESCTLSGAVVQVPEGGAWTEAARRLRADDLEFDEPARELIPKLATAKEWIERKAQEGPSWDQKCRLALLRMKGMTLQEAGEQFGFTRERARQCVSDVLTAMPAVTETALIPLFSKYDMNTEQFCALTGLGEDSYGYLRLVAKTARAERRPLSAALDDSEFPQGFKDRLMAGGILNDLLFIDGEAVPITKMGITEHILRAAGHPMSLEELYGAYVAFLGEHGLPSEGSLDPTSERAFAAIIDRFDKIMDSRAPASFDAGKRNVRLYDYGSKDFSELIDELSRYPRKNVELSAECLYNDPALSPVMASLDIRNGYELHDVLQYLGDSIRGVTVKRSPMVMLGDASRDEQVLGLIRDIGPADAAELAAEYEIRYGVRAATFRANFLDGFDQYLGPDGKYVLVDACLDEDGRRALRTLLVESGNWCSAEAVKARFAELAPGWSGQLFSRQNLEGSGYSLEGNLLVKDGFDRRAEFAALLDSTDGFKVGEGGFDEELFSDADFIAELNIRLRAFKLLEVDEGRYLPISVFEGLDEPLCAADFQEFLSGAIEAMTPGRPYSVACLRRMGLTVKLDAAAQALGLDDRFIGSVLGMGYVGGALKRTSINGTVVVARMRGGLTLPYICEWIVKRRGDISFDELLAYLRDVLGAQPLNTSLRFALSRANVVCNEDYSVIRPLDGQAVEGEDTQDIEGGDEATEVLEEIELEPEPEPEPGEERELVIDHGEKAVAVDGRAVDLTAREFEVLAYLSLNPSRVITREELYGVMFGESAISDLRTADSHVKNLRAKLGEDARSPRWIFTVHGVGYRFEPNNVRNEGLVDGVEVNAVRTGAVEIYDDVDCAGTLTIDRPGHRVYVDDNEKSLTASEYQVLIALVDAGGLPLSRAVLCEVLGLDSWSERGVDSHVKNLRNALGDDARNPHWIRTLHGQGYAFAGTSQQIDDVPATEAEPPADEVSGVSQEALAELKAEVERLEADLAEKTEAFETLASKREEFRSLKEEIPRIEEEIASYGFFRMSEKRAAKDRLEDARARLASLRGEGSGYGLARTAMEAAAADLEAARALLDEALRDAAGNTDH